MTILNNGIANTTILLSKESLGHRMEMGVLNTVLGMAIVFAVLTLIIFVISLFKYLPNIASKENNKSKASDAKVSPVDNAIAQIVHQEETNLMNDHELVAVITAAIASMKSEGLSDTTAGGFVVRSIRKVNNRRILY
ncbi:MAG: OadG family protein [Clostridiales bacterium]|jgi:sodium pump decarboxylase gamma subunit|nr:OadG family protein [Clostridiales bacterium]